MSAPPSGSDSLPDDDATGDDDIPNVDDLDLGDADVSGEAASDPESARQEAEDALAEIEALADLEEDPDTGGKSDSGAESGTGPHTSSGPTSADTGPSTDASGATGDSGDAVPEDQCENCGALLHGPYCSECGQRAADRIVPIWHMVNEALEAVFELDLRVLRTFPRFLFLPGRLTKEYLNGRRKRYIRPFRLYLFSTFLLFAVIALTTTGNFGFTLNPQGMARFEPPDTDVDLPTTQSDDSAARSSTPQNASLFGNSEERKEYAKRIRSDTSSVQFNLDLYDDPSANDRLEAVLREKTARAVENPLEAVNSLIDRGPYLMFVMLPIFAFLLKLFYIRQGRLYVEHMIFSLHVHAFAFFAFTGALLLNESNIGWLNTAATWVELSPLLYFVLALSHVYEQGLIKSSIKAFILFLIYSIVLAIGFAVLVCLAVLLM